MKEFVKVCSRSLGLGGRPEKSDNRATTNMLLASAVVVWEWLNEHGRWRPYSPAVSHQIEAAIRSSDPRGGSVVLGQVDSRLSPYIIDLQSMHQFRQDTDSCWHKNDLDQWGFWENTVRVFLWPGRPTFASIICDLKSKSPPLQSRTSLSFPV
uniref:WWE domain-containing protein n=1 Tax=Nothobranchius furzeri TaxID=105023 RepID=A0A8C6P4H1_NOTFU